MANFSSWLKKGFFTSLPGETTQSHLHVGGVGPPRVALLPGQRRAHRVRGRDAVAVLDQLLGVHGVGLGLLDGLELLLRLEDGRGLKENFFLVW